MSSIQCPHCGYKSGVGPTEREAFIELGDFDDDKQEFEEEGPVTELMCEICGQIFYLP